MRRLFALMFTVAAFAAACGSNTKPDDEGEAGSGGTNTGSGGSSNGGKGGASTGTGGAATGGTSTTGGATTGGKSGTGGTSTGGSAGKGGGTTGGATTGGKSGTGGTSTGGSSTGGSSAGGLGNILTEPKFNSMFPNRNALYTYAGLIEAAKKYSSFGNEGTDDAKKQEVAAFFAHIAHETAELKFIQEQNPASDYCDKTNTTYPCATGKRYFGRGPLQLSWNYNYGLAGKALGKDFLANPDQVSSDSVSAWSAALWFWMESVSDGKNTCHGVMRAQTGFGTTIQLINGALECGGKKPDAVNARKSYYQLFCSQFSVDSGTNQSC